MNEWTAIQQQFYRHLKDPTNQSAPSGLEERRLTIYRDLFFNNIKGFLSQSFPVLSSLFTEAGWQGLCRQFFAAHHSRSPYFAEISKEFVEYLDSEYTPEPDEPECIAQLAHYEWVELALDISTAHYNVQDLLSDVEMDTPLRLSPLAWVLSYDFRVHQIGPDYIPERPSGPFYYVVHRNHNFEVRFTELMPLNALILDTLESNAGMTPTDMVNWLKGQLDGLSNEQIEVGALQALRQFAQLEVVLKGHNER